LSVEQLLVLIVLLIFGYASLTARSKSGKLMVHYTSQTKTESDRWVKEKNGTVIVDNKEFEVLPDAITSFWLTKGFNWFFPTRVNYIKYSWYNRFPHDPNNYSMHIYSPALRKIIDKGEMMQSYFKSSNPATGGKKQSAMMAYLPLITILALVMMAFYFYSNQEVMMQHLMQLQNSMNAITK